MEVRKYTYVDIHYTKKEMKKAKKEQKRLERLGYELQVNDLGSGEHDFCDQYLRDNKHETK